MADFASVAEWNPSAIRAEVIDGAAPGKGTRHSVVSRLMGRDVPLECTTTEYPAIEPGHTSGRELDDDLDRHDHRPIAGERIRNEV